MPACLYNVTISSHATYMETKGCWNPQIYISELIISIIGSNSSASFTSAMLSMLVRHFRKEIREIPEGGSGIGNASVAMANARR